MYSQATFLFSSVAECCDSSLTVILLQQICSHGLLDITVKATGDTWIDDHHTVEDIALAFGGALSEALGDRAGIRRFGDFSAPLDEALIHVVLVCSLLRVLHLCHATFCAYPADSVRGHCVLTSISHPRHTAKVAF